MTTLRQTPAARVSPRAQRKGPILAGWLSSTDHKVIGHLYLITSFFFFLCAGIMALIIVSFHGGAEGTDHQHVKNGFDIFLGENRGNLPAFTHAVIDAGADLVLGHGPHVMRGMELYNGHLIVYSMGNFCTYGWFQLAGETALSEIVEIKIAPDGKFLSGRIHAARPLHRRGSAVAQECAGRDRGNRAGVALGSAVILRSERRRIPTQPKPFGS